MSSPEQREHLRDTILLIIKASISLGITSKAVGVNLRPAGYTVSDEVLEEHLFYLEGKGFIARESAEISAGLSRYKLTAAGREYLEANPHL